MVKAGTGHDVSSPVFGYRKVNDRVEHERVYVAGCPRRLRGLERRCAQRQIVELEVEPQSEIPADVAGDACGTHPASAPHKLLRRAIGQVRTAANIKAPILVVVSLCSALPSDFVGRGLLAAARFLTAAGLLVFGLLVLRLLLGLGLVAGWLLRRSRLSRSLLSVDGCDSCQDRDQHCRWNEPKSRNPCELSNHSFSSRCRA